MRCHYYNRLHREREVSMKVLQKSTLVLDIMIKGTFICQIQMPYCPLFPLDEKEVSDYVTEKRPSLKGKDFTIEFSTNAPLLRTDTNVGG